MSWPWLIQFTTEPGATPIKCATLDVESVLIVSSRPVQGALDKLLRTTVPLFVVSYVGREQDTSFREFDVFIRFEKFNEISIAVLKEGQWFVDAISVGAKCMPVQMVDRGLQSEKSQ